MLKVYKALVYLFAITLISASVTIFLIVRTSASTQEEESLRQKQKIEENYQKIIEEKYTAAEKAGANKKLEAYLDSGLDVIKTPSPEPDEFKAPHQFDPKESQIHMFLKCYSGWYAGGYYDPKDNLWCQFVITSKTDEETKQEVISCFVMNDRFDGNYPSPNQDAGKIYIVNVDIHKRLAYLKMENGTTGTFNWGTHEWKFDK